MLKSKARWNIREQASNQVDELVSNLNIAPLVAKLLINRGFDTVEVAKKFLYKEQMTYHDPFLLDDMEKTVLRIRAAVDQNEKILIFGDYDADGVSSTTVMYCALRSIGAKVDFYIPNRFTEGYGPNEPAIRKAKEQGYDLIVTVDTGIAAVEVAKVAKEIGLDFIVTDHHEAPPVLPDAYAIINPKKPGCPYPFKGLAGVGVAFKVAHALLGRVPTEWLDIVVIGTVADLVPLVDENRLLVMEGLHALQSTEKPGLIALKKKCGITSQTVQADHVGFGIGPRINAAGRLDSADPAVHLLLSESHEEAEMLASEIDDLNKERQAVVSEITEAAIQVVEEQFPPTENEVLIVAGEGWNAGVIGIVASRLVERYYRPTIVLSIDPEKGLAKGSARSIEGFDMFTELSKSRDILPHFGGHPMAAGLTMKADDLAELRERLCQQAKEVLTEEDFKPVTAIDLVAGVDEVSVEVIKQMEQLAPFGVSNPTPKVLLQEVQLDQMRKIGSDSNHLKVGFTQNAATLDGIGFHLGYLCEEITSQAKVSVIGTLSINEWNGHVKPQLMIEDVSVSEWQLFDWRSIQRNRLVERLSTISEENRVLLAFKEQTKTILGLEQFQVIHLSDDTSQLSLENKSVVLLDIPDEREQLIQLFRHVDRPSRIYTIFHQEEDSFFTTNPNREQFKWFYAFLLKRKTFNMKKHSEELAKFKGWSRFTIDFMSKVFSELGFVTIDNGIIHVNENPSKKNLEESATYKRKKEQAIIENEFVYSSYMDLKQWFQQVFQEKMNDGNLIKETV